MSALNQSGEEHVECPLCLEPLEVDDLNFYPCTCGYQICRFCWNRIREGENGLCPACRKAYPENPADFTPLSREQVAAIKTEKRSKEQRRRNKTLESRRQLANVRVVQKNLVFVVGLPVRLADPEVLKKQEYFGKYGKIHKVVINQSTAYAGAQGPSASAYVTYVVWQDALRAIQSVNNVSIDGRVLKGSLGTTKYCANFMKNQPCPKPDCMYLHEFGDQNASFTKEQMHQGLHQEYERKLHNQLIASMANGGSNSTNGNSNNSNCSSNSVPASSSITILNNTSKKDSGQSSSSLSSQCSSGSVGSLSGSGINSNGAMASNGQLTNGTREAWPSLCSSPDRKHQTSPNNILNHSPEPEYRTSQSDTADSSLDKEMPSDDSRDNYLENITGRNQCPPDIGSVFESRRPFSTLSTHIDSSNDNDSLIDSDEHRLLDDDTHNLLETSLGGPSMSVTQQLGPGFPSVMAHRSKLASSMEYELLLRQQRLPELSERLAPPLPPALSPHAHANSHPLPHSHFSNTDVMQKFFSEFSLGQQMKQQNVASPPHQTIQNNLPQLPTDVPTHAFIESQHLQRRYGQNALHNGHSQPQMAQANHSPQMQPLTQIEHMNQINQLNQISQMNQVTQMNQLRQMMGLQMGSAAGQIPNLSTLSSLTAQMSNLTAQMSNISGSPSRQRSMENVLPDDDLDFDPFKETQKAFADLIENDLLHRGSNMGHQGQPPPIHQNGVTGFNSPMMRGGSNSTGLAPPPGFQPHMNAFGLGVPRPQQTQSQPQTNPHSPHNPHPHPHGHTDWTQMDPAIVSTSVSQPQQQDAFSRFANMGMGHPQQMASKQASPMHNGQSANPQARGPEQGRGDPSVVRNGLNGHFLPQQPKMWPNFPGLGPHGALNHMALYGMEGANKTVLGPVPPGFNISMNGVPMQNSGVSNAECIESK